MAVSHEKVEPPVVVHVEETDTPAEKPSIDAQAGKVGVVIEVAVAEVEVDRIGVTGEIRFDDVQQAIAVVVADGDAHACLRLSFGRVSDACLGGYILEGTVRLILI